MLEVTNYQNSLKLLDTIQICLLLHKLLLGEEVAGLCASLAFVVCFVRVSFCHFSLPLGVGG